MTNDRTDAIEVAGLAKGFDRVEAVAWLLPLT
jgi:hypothetical protein